MGTHQKLAGAIGIDLERTPQWDPFRSADDDYAVLEWMRLEGIVNWQLISQGCEYCFDYKIGDYARVACVLWEIDCD